MRTARTLTALMLLANAAVPAAPISLVENEYAFAQAVADHGICDGFLMYLDKQAVTLAPLPVNAYDSYSKRKPSSTRLSWYPGYALVSAAGDFGVDSGPWTAQWTRDGKPQQVHGDWLTVWERDKAGQWHALFDGGTDHGAYASAPAALAPDAKVPQLPAASAVDTQAALQGIAQAEAQFSTAMGQSGPRAAYGAQAADELRLMEEGSLTLSGKAAVLQTMADAPARVQWVAAGASAAASGDLGYAYGMTYSIKDTAHAQPQGSYMHVWRRDAAAWKLLVDLELPAAPPGK